MPYLLDTDWAIQSLNRVEPVRLRLQELRPLGVAISAVSVAELYDGVFGSYDPTQDEAALLAFLGEHEVLPVDIEISRIFGRERQRLRSLGFIIGDMDLLIGATAIRHDLTVLTSNVRHFERIDGVEIESI